MPSQSISTSSLPGTGLPVLLADLDIPGEIQLPNGFIVKVGKGQALYRVIFRSKKSLRTPMTELAVGNAYIANEIDVHGDLEVLFNARQNLKGSAPLRQKLQFVWDHIRTTTTMNAKAISEHYNRGDDFYLTFIDTQFRFYSHGLFKTPTESIEEASEHKLESMFSALDLKEGMRLLDIGGGWGGVTQYCGARGIHVTTLTIAPDSACFIRRLISDNDLPGEVHLQDFLDHTPDEPYDHAVIYGVIEHIPDYRRFATKVWDVLQPGGRLYLDGAAAVEKFDVSPFTRDYVWTGTHTFMTVQDVLGELLNHGFEILDLKRESRDYQLTMLEWAKRLDAAKDSIVEKWGEETYRIFRLFLWGGQHAFQTNSLQAYHLVAERTGSRGPRPSTVRRIIQFLGSLV